MGSGSTSPIAQRQPNASVSPGATSAITSHPIGTPVCFTEKSRLRRFGGVKRMRRCEADGVSSP